jgi:CheY-like chemotaxis protein
MLENIAKPRTILVVEDSPDGRLLMQKALKMEGYSVLVAADGHAAFEILEQETPIDLILLDLSMPQMGGADFMARFHYHGKAMQTKVVLVSGWNHLEATAAELGADGFLRKPIDLDTLYREVERQLAP